MKSQNKAKSLLLILAVAVVMAVGAPSQAATIVLSTNGAGFQTNLSLFGAAANWQAAETNDGDTSYVYTTASGYAADFYELTDVALSGTINSVTVYVKARSVGSDGTQDAGRTVIRTEGATFVGSNQTLTTIYADYSTTYLLSPQTLAAWTWDEVNALQAGVSLRRSGTTGSPPHQEDIESRCTQVWVVVDYTSSDYEGLSHGYWKNHTGNWPATGYSPAQSLGSVFTQSVTYGLDNYTLLEALNFQGGDTLTEKAQILFIQAVGALLNASHPNIDYPLTPAQVITYVDAALASGDEDIILELKDELDGYNNLGGDINT